MTSYLWILLFGVLVITKAQELDLGDALGGDDEPTPKPAEPPKTGGGELDLGDAFGGDDEPTPKPAEPPKTGGGGLDLEDALLPDLEDPVTEAPKQPVIPPNDGGAFSDSDLNIDGHKPDPGQGGRSRANSGDTTDFQDDQPKEPYPQWLKLLTLLRRPKAGRWRASLALWQWPYLAPRPAISLTRRRNSALRGKEEPTLRVVETKLAISLIHKLIATSSDRPNS
ncbi:CD99 molecule isoform X1 [Neoarius graeffei]|uniref:CD99 molecule isoform X1 n=1 Tax=Neoarius graeffei TaxID=443677 RepID=UPI00298D22FD|nr:CD99 molecule isoform X1 [Neoarius graeffei]